MAVTYIKDRTTDDIVGYERHSQSDASLLLTRTGEVAEFELSLTIGDAYAPRHPTEDGAFVGLKDNQVVIAAHSCVTVEVAEEISVPLNLFGVIFPKGSLAHMNGVFVPTTKIDPGFSGRLRLLVFNGSGRRIVLAKGQAVATAVFIRTDATVRHPLVEKREKLTPTVQGLGEQIREFAKRQTGVWTTILVPLLSLIVAAGSLWYTAVSARAAQEAVAAADQAVADSKKPGTPGSESRQ